MMLKCCNNFSAIQGRREFEIRMSKPREEKYQAILDAATEAFAEYGYFSCQVSKIAKLAGVADGTIYLYFKNKEDILVSLFSERMGQFIQEIRHQIVQC